MALAKNQKKIRGQKYLTAFVLVLVLTMLFLPILMVTAIVVKHIIIVFVGVPLVFGAFTTSGFWLNFVVIHILFAYIVGQKEKDRTERLRKQRVRDLTRGR